MKPQKRYCPECDDDTSQRIEQVEPNNPDGVRVFICNRCGECTGYVEDEKLISQMKHLWEKEVISSINTDL